VIQGQDELLTIAEIAVGIAGFSGVAAAFFQQGGLQPVDGRRLINLFSAAFTAIFLAFVPISFGHLGVEGRGLWVASSAVMAGMWFANTGIALWTYRLIQAHVTETTRVPFLMISIPSAANLFVQLANVFGFWWEPGFVPYLFGLLVYLYSAGLIFLYLVLYRPDA